MRYCQVDTTVKNTHNGYFAMQRTLTVPVEEQSINPRTPKEPIGPTDDRSLQEIIDDGELQLADIPIRNPLKN